MPVAAERVLNSMPDDVWTKLNIEFYSDPAAGLIRALMEWSLCAVCFSARKVKLMPHPLYHRGCMPKQGLLLSAKGEVHRPEGNIGDGPMGIARRAVYVRESLHAAIQFLAPDPKYIDKSSFDDVAVRLGRRRTCSANRNPSCLVGIRDHDAVGDRRRVWVTPR